MEDKFIHSFRYRNLWYSILSAILALLTVLFFLGIVHFISYTLLSNQEYRQALETATSDYKNQTSNSSNNSVSDAIYQNSLNLKYAPDVNTKNSQSNGELDPVVYLVALFIGFASFITYFMIFTKKMSSYLKEISKGIDELAIGNFDVRIPLRNDDEFTRIAQNLNRMAVEIKAIMEEERNTESKKNELITNVAHDLRTPLTSIIGYLDLVSKKDLPAEIKDKYIGIAYNKSIRLEKLIEDLFSYTKFEFGEVKFYKKEVDIVKMLYQLLDEFYPSFTEYGLEYSFDVTVPSAVVSADGDYLARAFANLIGNAIKYGADGKNINLRLEVKDTEVIVTITNYGEVIPKKDITHIFEKFYRVEYSRNEEHGGTGLGLAIARNIFEMHGGQVTARSGLDGTVFEVILPIGQ
ncbi:sensor histidine kinase [Lachnoclostridium phytofermentans]|uniref:histidine kinase n=1 Tax=Lachnoclostridium phytofermentans (strain ATCC 700394 / DSM 18823 / ISDg) TaxID=357809 RepID=A9KI19_LACP7|nr:HAMP domain-containing sensor histidine kinase [Lachnoclostridium phytofermentans]ABX43866.1 integral membrane sensor signal transduction histidine kinase [Lachnoclostridium phytofermentans ISDg]